MRSDSHLVCVLSLFTTRLGCSHRRSTGKTAREGHNSYEESIHAENFIKLFAQS
jgi:hypothetical protein